MKSIKQYIFHLTMSITLAFGVMIVLTGCDHIADSGSSSVTWRGQPFDSTAQEKFLHEFACPGCPPRHP